MRTLIYLKRGIFKISTSDVWKYWGEEFSYCTMNSINEDIIKMDLREAISDKKIREEIHVALCIALKEIVQTQVTQNGCYSS